MKKVSTLFLIFILLGMVVSAGCMGGGGSSNTQSTESSANQGSSSMTSTSSAPQTSTSSTATQSSSTTSTESSTTTESQTTTTSPTETTTPTEEAYWEHPWEYVPVVINGKEYRVVEYTITYKVRPTQDSPLYEYRIHKSVRKTKVHVYGTDMMGGKVDLGEKEVYEYTTVVEPVKAQNLEDKLILKLWFKVEAPEVFIYPWNMGWMVFASPYSVGNNTFVGMEMDYRGNKFTITNAAAYQQGLFPSFEGDSEWMSDINDDLTNLYMGWFAVMHLGIWAAWSDKNLLVPQSGTWSDGMHSWEWSTKPDGTVTFSGVTFRLVDAEWKYVGSPEEVSMNGKSRFSPKLFLPIEVDGYFTYQDESGKSVTVYGYLKIEDLKLEQVG